jgi:hypothetical protein
LEQAAGPVGLVTSWPQLPQNRPPGISGSPQCGQTPAVGADGGGAEDIDGGGGGGMVGGAAGGGGGAEGGVKPGGVASTMLPLCQTYHLPVRAPIIHHWP